MISRHRSCVVLLAWALAGGCVRTAVPNSDAGADSPASDVGGGSDAERDAGFAADAAPHDAPTLEPGADIAPSPEACDGLDNDLDGVIDDGDPGGGASCRISSDGAPLCAPGTLHCRAGRLQCEGGRVGEPEACNCVDDDCNGQVDDERSGALCESGRRCLDCECRSPCAAGEFPCPAGQMCSSVPGSSAGFCVPDPCARIACTTDQVCRDGRCTPR